MTSTTAAVAPQATARPNDTATNAVTPRIPFTRIVGVELRKSFDTRSGLWLLISIGLAALVTTGAVIAWAPTDEFRYSQFTLAIGMPMSIILAIITVLSVTAEWSQRSGLTTFTLVPHRGRVMLGKALSACLVAVAATGVAFAVGALGNLAGPPWPASTRSGTNSSPMSATSRWAASR